MARERRGDPEGRRPAKYRAATLGEAGYLARAVQALIQRAGLSIPECEDLTTAIAKEEYSALQRSYGQIAPRRKYKGQTVAPLLDGRHTNYIFIDESGKSSKEPEGQPQFFALGAISLPESEVDKYVQAADAVKLEYFGTTNLTFHEPKMRNHRDWYGFGGDKNRQKQFDAAIGSLIDDTDFVAFGVGVRKSAFEQEFVATGIDPYLPTDAYAVAITMLMERYVDYLATTLTPRSIGRITFESQGPLEDATHQLEYARLLIEGSQCLNDKALRNWLETGLRFEPKSGSNPMELSDMFARDLFEWIKGECNSTPKRWDSFSRKVYCRGDGQMGTFGIKIFPDSDIRDRIEAHRAAYGAVTGGN